MFYIGQKVRCTKEMKVRVDGESKVKGGKEIIGLKKDGLYVVHDIISWTCKCGKIKQTNIIDVGIVGRSLVGCSECDDEISESKVLLHASWFDPVDERGNPSFMAQVSLLHLLAKGLVNHQEYLNILKMTESPDPELLELAQTLINNKNNTT